VRTDLSEQLTELIPRLRRFASGLTGSTDRGDELVQAACERLLGHHAGLRADTRLDSWMYRVIRNLHVDAIRAQSVRDRGAQQIRLVRETQPVRPNGLEDHLHLHDVHDAMQELPEEQRAALMLVCVEGLSYKEAAEVLQVPMGTVTSRLLRGRKALIALLDHDDAEFGMEISNER
jgi:RNA polymerase sigma-70 factor (ECF subfamily)